MMRLVLLTLLLISNISNAIVNPNILGIWQGQMQDVRVYCFQESDWFAILDKEYRILWYKDKNTYDTKIDEFVSFIRSSGKKEDIINAKVAKDISLIVKTEQLPEMTHYLALESCTEHWIKSGEKFIPR